MNPIAKGMGVLSKVSWAIWWKTFPRAWKYQYISRSAGYWGFPLSFPIIGGIFPYKISRRELPEDRKIHLARTKASGDMSTQDK